MRPVIFIVRRGVRTLATECDKGFEPRCGGIAVLICAIGAASSSEHRVAQINEAMAQALGSGVLQPEPLEAEPPFLWAFPPPVGYYTLADVAGGS